MSAANVRAEDFGAVLSFLDAMTPARVECMECGVVMSPGAEPVSHGVCPECVPAVRRRYGLTTTKEGA